MNDKVLISVSVAVIVLLGICLLLRRENFYDAGQKNTLTASPYYSSVFQLYPGKYMHFGSDRASYCLQMHPEYSGFRNCMLYLQ